MTRIIADFHVHSGYSRATSKDMNVVNMASWAKKKGINLLGTGDFTHPVHFSNLRSGLNPAGTGLYTSPLEPSVFFIFTAEISSIYSYKGKVRRTHNLIMAPSIEIAEKINRTLQKTGNLSSDGRPILGTPAKDLLKIVLDISEDCLFVPAHVWTPWFSLFGSKSGFDSIEECFDEYAQYIHAIETGLSSDPEMNWRLSALDDIALISNSDAHSPSKLGREANVFHCDMDYYAVINTIKKKDKARFLYTVEFFPQEGKYHFDGHRQCNVLFSPDETKKHNRTCPVCKKPITVGVMSRVDELADRKEGFIPDNAIPSKHLVPLQEIIAGAFNAGSNTVMVKKEYERLVASFTEFEILLDLPESELYKITQKKIAEGILKVRSGGIDIIPGYDGEYGKVSIFSKQSSETRQEQSLPVEPEQRGLF
ncbi:MAG: DNA helicase UvrD [Thermodesulfovibrionia bacterium]|nr:DNA helicase UvrD [Thermodesulfovibrionia bacterium]